MKRHWISWDKPALTLLVNSAEREKPAFGVTDIQNTAITAYLYSQNKNVGVDTPHVHWIPNPTIGIPLSEGHDLPRRQRRMRGIARTADWQVVEKLRK